MRLRLTFKLGEGMLPPAKAGSLGTIKNLAAMIFVSRKAQAVC